MTRRIPALAVAAALLASLVLAGCGSDYGSSSSSTAPQQTRTGTVRTADSDLGTVLVGAGGRTVYLFERDRGPRSTCSGACVAQWPAVTTDGAPQAGGRARTAMLGTTRRADDTTQVTYAGHPLYYYAGDGAAGDVNGQALDAFGAKWFVVSPSGTAITRQASGTASGGYGN
jgi:predicted lipoprotein with Yx(FWY)xxD motif